MRANKLRWLAAMLTVAIGSLFHASAVAMTNLVETFDAGTVGKVPFGWQTGGGGFAVVTNDVAQSKPNSLVLANTKIGEPAYALKALEPTIPHNAGEPVLVSFHIRLAQTNAAVNIMLTGADTSLLLRICFNNAGKITATEGDADADLGGYEAGTWYEVRALFTATTGKYQLAIRAGDRLVAGRESLPLKKNKIDTDFFYFYLQNYGMPDGQAKAQVDDVIVAWPGPNTL